MADTAIETLREEIKEFLKGADLSSASSKKVRSHLNDKFDCDFSSRKNEIDKVVMEVLTELEGDEKKDSEDDDDVPEDDSGDNYSEEEKPKARKPPARKPAAPKKKRSKGYDSEEESEDPSDDDDDSEDDRKKKKKRASNGGAKARKSGGGGGGGGGGKAKATGYLKKLKLSPELSAVMGEELMARNEVVKKMYAVVKERDLLDPKNRQFAILDEQLQNVFGQKRVRMFGMLKLLGKHFSAAD